MSSEQEKIEEAENESISLTSVVWRIASGLYYVAKGWRAPKRDDQ